MMASATARESTDHRDEPTTSDTCADIEPSHGVSVDVQDDSQVTRPTIYHHHLSAPAYQSPLRHHRRAASEQRVVKETLNARSEYTNNEEDGKAEHHINQYIIKDEIGRGSFGAVHLAVDQYGQEYAVKEFSKARLRKRAQSNILRRPRHVRRPGHLAAGGGLNAPLHRHSASEVHNSEEQGNPLYLIKEEIAIMKKLNHPNLVSLIEVLDDPEEDSLYMVLEMCKKGVVMKVGLGEKADPYSIESCRCWFRDLILGIEYLHAQGVVHRDIKPDNLLLTENDVLKIVDFGVSEMFEKQSEMLTAKSAGSPAFLPPELCVTKHGDISGRASDIWSMGISLYCLRFGRIPFEQSGVLELYDAIKNETLSIDDEHEPEFCDLLTRLLEKDPKRRIGMEEIREHPWVTKHGKDPLLSIEENTAELVEPPSELEVNHAITAKMRHLITLMIAVKKFKSLVEKKRPLGLSEAPDHQAKDHSRAVLPHPPPPQKAKSDDTFDRKTAEGLDAPEVSNQASQNGPNLVIQTQPARVDASADIVESPVAKNSPTLSHACTPTRQLSDDANPPRSTVLRESSGEKGHARDPLDEEPPFLGIGTGAPTREISHSFEPPAQDAIAESPTAAEFSIYDTAYQEEVERIRSTQGQSATVYLTRRIDTKKEYIADKNMVDIPAARELTGVREEFKELVDKAREKSGITPKETEKEKGFLGNFTSKTIANVKASGSGISSKLDNMAQRVANRKWNVADDDGEVDVKKT